MKKTSLIEFPCRFPIKVMGRAEADLGAEVVEIIRRHIPQLNAADLKTVSSRGGNYVSVTVTITATSQDQLDAIYRELSSHTKVIMAL